MANFLLEQGQEDPEKEAAKFFNEKITTIEEALQGARDIIAEMVSENIDARTKMRQHFTQKASYKALVVKGKEEVKE